MAASIKGIYLNSLLVTLMVARRLNKQYNDVFIYDGQFLGRKVQNCFFGKKL